MATIAENLNILSAHLDAAYAAISAAGGEIPQERRAGNLSAAVVTIPSGGGQFGMTVPRLKDAHDLGGMLSGNDMVSSVSFPQLSACAQYTFEEAFKGCKNLKEVSLPNLISTDGDVFKNAFISSGIEKFELPKLVSGRVGCYNGFQHAKNLKSVSISALPEVASDGYQFDSAFKGCTSLSSIDFHSLSSDNGLRNSFYCLASDLTSLKKFDFSSLASATGRSSFQYVFSTTGLVSAEFPALVNIGGQETFRGALGWCPELTSASFPELTSVSANGMQTVLKECPKLEQVSFPKLQYIHPTKAMHQAMQNCSSLTSIEFPALLGAGTEALREAFSGCTSLTSASMPALLSVNQNGFYRAFASCDLYEVELPALTSTQAYAFKEAFRDNHNLTSVSMPNLTSTNNTQVFADAFVNCSSLLSVEVGISGTLAVGAGMFMNSSGQSSGTRWSLVLGDVTTINAQAFLDNTSIKIIDFRNCSSVPTIYSIDVFNGVSALTCVIPETLDGTWQLSGNWPALLAYNDQVTIQTEVEPPSYFTIVNRSNVNDTGTMTWSGVNPIDFSTDDGATWYEGDDNEFTFTVPANGQTMFRHRPGNSDSGFRNCHIRNLQQEHDVKGRIGTLVEDPTVTQTPYTFANMFEGDTHLVDASGLVLDCMAERCYDWMFAYDTSLTAGPQFTSQTAEAYCYTLMFYNCGSLSRLGSPLPNAQVNGETPYYELFNGCNIDSISVEWTSWPEYGGRVATPDWMSPFAEGDFFCPSSLGTNATITRGQSYVPSGFLVTNF